MGSCVSTEDDEPRPNAHLEPVSRSQRRNLSRTGGSEASRKTSEGIPQAPPPGCVAEADAALSLSKAPPLEPFDVATCPPAAVPWFDALCRCEMTGARRQLLHEALGHTEKQQAALRSAAPSDLNGAFFSGVHDTILTLDATFAECAGVSENLNYLDAEGIEQLAATLELTDVHVLYVLHVLGCSEGPWRVDRQTFVDGCMRHLVVSADDLRQRAQQWAADYDALKVKSPGFGAFYRFLFGFVKAPGARCIPADVASGLWESVLAPKWDGGTAWLGYFADTASEKPVFRDLWMQLGFFAETVTWPGCAEADEDSAWPSMIDSFIDHVRHPQ